MKIILTVLLVALLQISPASAQKRAQKPTPKVKQVQAPSKIEPAPFVEAATVALAQKDVPKAKELLNSALAADPKHGPAWFNLGVIAMAQQSWDEAEKSFKRFLEITPTGVWAERARKELALAQATNLVGKTPSDEEYAQTLGLVRSALRASNSQLALSAAEKCISLAPRDWRGYAAAASVALVLNKHAEAEKLLGQAESMTTDPKVLESIKNAHEAVWINIPFSDDIKLTPASLRASVELAKQSIRLHPRVEDFLVEHREKESKDTEEKYSWEIGNSLPDGWYGITFWKKSSSCNLWNSSRVGSDPEKAKTTLISLKNWVIQVMKLESWTSHEGDNGQFWQDSVLQSGLKITLIGFKSNEDWFVLIAIERN